MGAFPQSFRVAATLTSQRIVEISAAQTVNLATSGGNPIGITKDDVDETTQGIPVAMAGEIAPLLFNDTVAAAGLVSSDASGRGVPFTAATVSAAYVGILLGAAVAATATIADVLVMPGRDSTG